jgi:hypothetical protein
VSELNEPRAIAADYDAEIAAAAGASSSPNKEYRRRLDEAADIVAKRSDAPFSPESLRKSGLPRIYVGRISLFADQDLFRYADEWLNSAALHQGPRSRSRRAAA